MGRHRAERKRSAWRPLAGAAIGASLLAIATNGAWAALNATAFNTAPETVTSGTLKLTMTAQGVGLAQNVSNLAPGDVVRRHVDVVNGGTLTGDTLTFGLAATGSSTLLADTAAGTKALRLSIASCSTAWSVTAGTCSGTATTLLAATPVGALGGPTTLVSGALASGATQHLQLTLTLPDQTETTTNGVLPTTTIQGQSADLTYTFTEAQRAAATTTS